MDVLWKEIGTKFRDVKILDITGWKYVCSQIVDWNILKDILFSSNLWCPGFTMGSKKWLYSPANALIGTHFELFMIFAMTVLLLLFEREIRMNQP